ncbi:hypothetical protein FKP32DRAFT_1560551 [Trametes sanguinea]|nr:hypothetical protein FKP32DRAFT_1560551 [Trametes sanguinea]
MTDFGSQGRTRPHNVCDLQNCQSHQSIYTCLSRGSTLDGTIIVQPSDASKLTGGITGSLRQEFRELELLDEITKLRYLGKMSSKVTGITHSELVHSYRKWKGEKHIPKTMHKALVWNSSNPFPIEDPQEEIPWQIVERPKKSKKGAESKDTVEESDNTRTSKQIDTTGYVPAKGSHALLVLNNTMDNKSMKRKREAEAETSCITKKARAQMGAGTTQLTGFTWDNVNYSCAYDSLLTILLASYTGSEEAWHDLISSNNKYLSKLTEKFATISENISEGPE